MNGDSYRGGQPSGGRVINRSAGSSYRPSDEQPRPTSAGSGGGGHTGSQSPALPSSEHSRKEAKKEKQPARRLLVLLSVVSLIGAIILGSWFAWDKVQNKATAIDGGKYQAVFLTNGQFYFGKLRVLNDGYLKLTDVYYMQNDNAKSGAATTEETNSSADTKYKLIKLGSEIHGPEDAMMISKDQILYYENIKDDGKVAQRIKQYSEK